MLKKVSLLAVLALALTAGMVMAAEPAADGSAAYPGEPEIRAWQRETMTTWCSVWSLHDTEIRCNWTWRCLWKDGCFEVRFYTRTCEYFTRWCFRNPFWPVFCTMWEGPFYRTETRREHTFLGGCGCTSPADCQ